MKAELTIIPKISIHPDRINIYNELHWNPAKPSRSKDPIESKNQFGKDGNIIEENQARIAHIINSKRKSNGIVSKNASKKMNQASNYLMLMSAPKTHHLRGTKKTFKFKIAFITLTLPSTQRHDDKEIINKCLNQFIIEIKKYYNVRNYIWRAEKQKNGNIHFHLLIDKFIPHAELRNRWNRIIDKLDYIQCYRTEQQTWHSNGFKPRTNLYPTWSKAKQLEAYIRGSKIHWSNPNSTDIHSVKNLNNVAAYIQKYMTKTEAQFNIKGTKVNIPIYQTGRIWGCNRELSKITGARTEIDSELEKELQLLMNVRESKVYNGEHFTVIYFDLMILREYPQVKLFQLFSQYMFNKFGFPLQTKIAS